MPKKRTSETPPNQYSPDYQKDLYYKTTDYILGIEHGEYYSSGFTLFNESNRAEEVYIERGGYFEEPGVFIEYCKINRHCNRGPGEKFTRTFEYIIHFPNQYDSKFTLRETVNFDNGGEASFVQIDYDYETRLFYYYVYGYMGNSTRMPMTDAEVLGTVGVVANVLSLCANNETLFQQLN